jgi:hypothetical protein
LNFGDGARIYLQFQQVQEFFHGKAVVSGNMLEDS